MNQRFRPLTCLCALAMLTAYSSDAAAAARHKPTHHAKKADAGPKHAGRKHQAAHKKAKHAANTAAARRKSTQATNAPAPAAPAAPLTGNLAAGGRPTDLVRK